jgi:hypothetical protein
MPAFICFPLVPSKFAAGVDLPVGTYHVQQVKQTPASQVQYTVARTVGLARWYPLTARENPAWMTWPTFEEAQGWISGADADGNLCDYPFWGR